MACRGLILRFLVYPNETPISGEEPPPLCHLQALGPEDCWRSPELYSPSFRHPAEALFCSPVRLCNATSFSKTIFTLILRFHYKYAVEMALKSPKRCTLLCFRASKNLEKSCQSGQNASKSLILYVNFTVTTVA